MFIYITSMGKTEALSLCFALRIKINSLNLAGAKRLLQRAEHD